MINACVNGIQCKFYYEERFSSEHAPIGYPYMYHLRHDEDDWTNPVMLERFVGVNFFGTVFMKEPIEFGERGYLDIERFNIESELIKIKLRKETISTIIGINKSHV